MKTKEEFQKISKDFSINVQWLNGNDFSFAVSDFMDRNNFESNTLMCLAKTYDGEISFITDNPQNDVGIVLKVVYGTGKLSFVGSKEDEIKKFRQSGIIELKNT